MRRARLCVPLALLCSLTALTGCRSGTALHSRYSNFRAFYNTYYNAERKLEEGEAQITRDDQPVDRTRLVALFPEGQGGSASGPFQEAIDKSAELLRDRPDSKWADDALLLIGKAYFYQGNVVGAEQKFRETIAAAEARDQRDLAAEATFWLGRTLAAAEQFDDGVAVLREATARPDADRRWRARLSLALGELYAREGQWDAAAEALRAGAPDVGDRDLSARAYLLLGQVEENAERWDAAATAYREADARAGAYELRYAARVSRALVLGLDAGRAEEALSLARAMRRDDKNYARRAEVELVYARLLAAAGQPEDAQGRFRDVLYDEALAVGGLRGEAHYRLGEFFRDTRDDYVRAAAHFDSAATTLRGAALQPGERAARAAVLDAPTTAQTFSGIAATLRRIEETDSLLALGALSDADFEVRIAEIEAARLRVFREERRRAAREEDNAAFSGGAFQRGPGLEGNAAREGGAPALSAEAGFLGFRDPTSVQTGRIAFRQTWGERPRLPNWRRRAAIEATADGGTIGDRQLELGLGDDQAGLPALDLSPIPRTQDQRNEVIVELAGLRYELGNAYFLSVDQPERAAALYRQILTDTPGAPVAVRARYALAELESAAGRPAVADALYREVAESSDVPSLTRAARIRLGELIEDEPERAPTETSETYDRIRARWTDGDPLGAAADFVAAGDAAPDNPRAPRYYLAGGTAYAEWLRQTGADWQAPLPDALRSDSLFAGVADRAAPAPPGANGAAPATQEPDAQDPGAALLRERQTPPPPPVGGPPVGAPPPVGGPPVPAPPDSASLPEPSDVPVPATLPADSTGSDVAPLDDPFDDLRLADYFAALAARYPGTAEAQRAEALRAALPAAPVAEAGPPEADSTATPPSVEPETSISPETPLAEEPLYGYRGGRPIDLDAEGVTWRVRRVASTYAATSTAAAFTALGFRARAVSDPDQGLVLIVGQFRTPGDAEAASEDAQDLLAALQTGDGRQPSLEVVELGRFDPIAAPVAAQTERLVSGLTGEDPVSPAAGGFAWRVLTGDAAELEEAAQALRDEGFRVLVVEGSPAQLLVGQFSKARAAQPTASDLPDLGEAPELVDLSTLGGDL